MSGSVMEARLLDRDGLEKLAADRAAARRERKRAYHEDQCAGIRLDMKLNDHGVRWFRCTKRDCGYVFSEHTEGAAAMVRRSGR